MGPDCQAVRSTKSSAAVHLVVMTSLPRTSVPVCSGHRMLLPFWARSMVHTTDKGYMPEAKPLRRVASLLGTHKAGPERKTAEFGLCQPVPDNARIASDQRSPRESSWPTHRSSSSTTPPPMSAALPSIDPRSATLSATRSAGSYSRPCMPAMRSEEHTSELQSLRHLVCRLLLE